MMDVVSLGRRVQHSDSHVAKLASLDKPAAFEKAIVELSALTSFPVPLFDICQLHAEHGRLNGIKAAIPANLLQPTFTLDRGLGPILSWDPRTLVPNGVLVYVPNPTGGNGQAYHVSEAVFKGLARSLRSAT